MQWCLLEDNNWETVHPNLWTKTIHHGPALYNEEVINYVESHWLRDKSNIDWHLSCLQFQLMFTVVYEAHIFKPFSQSDALRPYERCAKGHRDLRLITWVASFMTFPQQSWHASTSYHSSIFHSPMNSGKAPLTPTSLNEIQQNGSKNQTPIMIICTWKNQRCCFVLSLLNETSEHWIQYASVSHNAWRRELCRLNLATRKKKKLHQQLTPQTELSPKGLPSLNIYHDVGNFSRSGTMPGAFTSGMIVAFPYMYMKASRFELLTPMHQIHYETCKSSAWKFSWLFLPFWTFALVIFPALSPPGRTLQLINEHNVKEKNNQ